MRESVLRYRFEDVIAHFANSLLLGRIAEVFLSWIDSIAKFSWIDPRLVEIRPSAAETETVFSERALFAEAYSVLGGNSGSLQGIRTRARYWIC